IPNLDGSGHREHAGEPPTIRAEHRLTHPHRLRFFPEPSATGDVPDHHGVWRVRLAPCRGQAPPVGGKHGAPDYADSFSFRGLRLSSRSISFAAVVSSSCGTWKKNRKGKS